MLHIHPKKQLKIDLEMELPRNPFHLSIFSTIVLDRHNTGIYFFYGKLTYSLFYMQADNRRARGQEVSFQLFSMLFLGSCIESMYTNPSYLPIFFSNTTLVLIMFWLDFTSGEGASIVDMFSEVQYVFVGKYCSIIEQSRHVK